MNRRSLPLLLALLLGACAAPSDTLPPPEPIASLQVEHVRVQYAAAYAPGQSDLAYNEAMRLETFLDQAGLRSADRVYIALPNGDPLAAARIGKIAALLARRGVGAETIPPPASGVTANHMLVLVDRYVVTPPACPNWSDSPDTPHTNTPNSNFGCATLSNLAQMVDNPRDLIAGRTLGPADADPGLHAIARYRADLVKPLIGGSTSGGAAPSGSMSSSGTDSSSSSSSPSSSSSAGAGASMSGASTTGGGPGQ
jgi:pilus assembly protein CpaD